MEPYRVFKYTPVNKYFLDGLVKGYIYCAPPHSLNDPFDCNVVLSESIDRAIVTSSGIHRKNLADLNHNAPLLSFIEDSVSKAGVCSFSMDLLKPVLWSHYAEDHKGVCCMYEIPEEFIDWKTNKIIGISDVEYGDNLITEALLSIAGKLPSLTTPEVFRELSTPIFSSKGLHWEYEQEVRIIRGESGRLNIDKDYLKQVCFGLHTSDNDMELVIKVITDSGYSPEFCTITKTHSDFGIEANDL